MWHLIREIAELRRQHAEAMSIMDYLKLVVAAATIAPTVVSDVKRFIEAFKDDKTVVAMVRTALEVVKTAANDIEAILPPAESKTEN